MSRRVMDMRAEGQLAQFLDEKFWSPLCADGDMSFKRVTDRTLQLQGVDVILTQGEEVRYIDEKAQLYYINNTLPTFAFEIDSFQRGYLTEGWLLNNALLTTDYNLIYPNARHNDLSIITKDDFTLVEVLSITKKVLLKSLESYGLTRSYLLAAAQRIRKQCGSEMYRENTMCRYAKFVKSASYRYSEAPLNLVVQKSFLRQIADCTVEVSQEGYRFVE